MVTKPEKPSARFRSAQVPGFKWQMQNAILMFSSSPDYKQAGPTHNAGPTQETV